MSERDDLMRLLEALQAENAALREIVQLVAEAPTLYQSVDVPMPSGRTAAIVPAIIGLDVRDRAIAVLRHRQPEGGVRR